VGPPSDWPGFGTGTEEVTPRKERKEKNSQQYPTGRRARGVYKRGVLGRV